VFDKKERPCGLFLMISFFILIKVNDNFFFLRKINLRLDRFNYQKKI